nr:FtsX-like permease family protein [Micromonospora sp. DSM 115978]
MRAILRLALAGLRGRRATAVATAVVSALAATGIVAGLAVQDLGGPQVDAVHREAGRPDLVVLGEPAALDRVRDDPAIADTRLVRYADVRLDIDGNPVYARAFAADEASRSGVGAPVLRTGRWPAPGAVGEVALDHAAAVRAGIESGTTVRVSVDGGGSRQLTVVGTALDLTNCFYPGCTPVRLFVDPTALNALVPDPDGIQALLVATLTEPGTAPAVAGELAGSEGIRSARTWADIRADILLVQRIFGAFLATFGIFVLVAAAFVTAGTAAARLVARRREIAMVQAVGYTGRQVMAGLVAETLLLGAVGVLVGWLAGVLLAPALQVGLADVLGRPDPSPALTPLAVAAGAVGLLLTAATVLPARRAARQPVSAVLRDAPSGAVAPARVAKLLDRLPLGAADRMGLGTVLARPLRSALAAGALTVAVTALIVSAGFLTAMDTMVSKPDQVGDPYDAIVEGEGHKPAEMAAALAAIPAVASWYGQDARPARVGEKTFVSRALSGDPAQARFAVREGRAPAVAGEAIAGYGLMRRLALRVGDTVDVVSDGVPVTVTVVGWYSESDNSGEVLLFRAETLPASTPTAYLVTARDGVSPEELTVALRDRLGPATNVSPRAGASVELSVFATALRLMAGLILLVSLINLGAVLLTGARERARTLGVLRTVGFTSWQTARQSAAGGAAIGLAAAAVGTPVGLLVYRALVDRTTESLGVGPGFARPPSAYLLGALVLAVLLVGALAGTVVSRRLTRSPIATLIRWE